jgi:lipoate-protein ligase A
MEFDERLASLLSSGLIAPTLRVYRWNPPAISLGYHQSFDDFDRNKLFTDGIDIVKRLTGGKAIFHSEELTYSVVMPSENTNLRDVYNFINRGLLEGVRMLGIDAELTTHSKDFRTFYKTPESISCFSSVAKSEIQVRGRKLVGSAQRRFGNVVLQHGSFLLGTNYLRLTDYYVTTDENMRNHIRTSLAAHSIDARTILGRTVSFDEAAEAIKHGFELAHGIVFHEASERVEEHLLTIS